MEAASQALFQTHGCSESEAFVLAAKLKYPAERLSMQLFASAKHAESFRNHAWMDRIFHQAAVLETSGKMDCDAAELEAMTGHADVRRKMAEEEKMVEEMLASGRKDRTEGFLTCRNAECKSKEIDVEQRQTRSADEPMTLFALCVKCGMRWTMK
jgi:DNA-directed RNA polymerase subunit M/transcription elongation factor TFIIS